MELVFSHILWTGYKWFALYSYMLTTGLRNLLHPAKASLYIATIFRILLDIQGEQWDFISTCSGTEHLLLLSLSWRYRNVHVFVACPHITSCVRHCPRWYFWCCEIEQVLILDCPLSVPTVRKNQVNTCDIGGPVGNWCAHA